MRKCSHMMDCVAVWIVLRVCFCNMSNTWGDAIQMHIQRWGWGPAVCDRQALRWFRCMSQRDNQWARFSSSLPHPGALVLLAVCRFSFFLSLWNRGEGDTLNAIVYTSTKPSGKTLDILIHILKKHDCMTWESWDKSSVLKTLAIWIFVCFPNS